MYRLIFFFIFSHIYIVTFQYTVYDIIIPLLFLFKISLDKHDILSSKSIWLFFVIVFSIFSVINGGDYFIVIKSIFQNLSVIYLISSNYNLKSLNFTHSSFIYVFILIGIIGVLRIAPFPDNFYEMVKSKPFFDSVDKGIFFSLLLGTVLRFKDELKKSSFLLFYILSFLIVVNISQSGSRIAFLFLCLFFPLFFFGIRNTIYVNIFLLFIITYIVIDADNFLLLLSDYSILSYKAFSALELILTGNVFQLFLDSSFLVRIENINQVFSSMTLINYLFGFGSEVWRSILINNVNYSLDNTLLTYFFNYGILGIGLYFWLIKSIYIKLGGYTTFIILLFSQIQDLFGNYLLFCNIIFFYLIHDVTNKTKKY